MLEHIQMQPLNSSNLDSCGFDADTRVLQVRFKNGSVYLFHGPTAEDYEGLLLADSPGQYFHQNIKPRFRGDKL